MGDAPIQHAPSLASQKRLAAVRRVVAEWRRLTGGSCVRDADRATLVACSGGADSSALAIALATTPARIALAHVVHDLRPRADALADRDAARDLADRLGLAFHEVSVSVRDRDGNAEGEARARRYEALGTLAVGASCPFIATAHHADDQLETVLMSLLRGAGPTGLSGIAPVRPLPEAMLVRPMLVIGRDEAESVCAHANWRWREDLTNADRSRTRAALRHAVIPELKSIRPDAAQRAAVSADSCREAAGSLRGMARRLDRAAVVERDAIGVTWRRAPLRRAPTGLVAELLRTTHRTIAGGVGQDRLARRVISKGVDLIRDETGGERSFILGRARIIVTRETVRMEAKGA